MNEDFESPVPPRDPTGPSIEELTAFLDGELSPEDWTRVQDWLASHPDDAALVQDHRDFLGLWRETTPAEPSEKAWGEAFARIDAQSHQAGVNVRTSLRRGRRIRVGLLGAAAAAAVILAIIAPWREPPDIVGLDGFPIATADDVDLVSIEGNDAQLLVVGNPPVHEPMELVASGDVTLVRMEPSDAPMIITPKSSESKNPSSK
jgi:hypothetical protein